MHSLPLVLVALLGLGAGACATKADVIATGQTLEAGSDGPFIHKIHVCVPGPYRGTFTYTKDPDAQIQYPVSGTLDFQLVNTRSGEFFTVQSGAKLSGKADNGYRISADIDTNVDGGSRGGCYEGVFKVDLIHGHFYQGDAATAAEFTGSVEGEYDAEKRIFSGKWKAFFAGVYQISQGDWQALWYQDF